MDLAKLKHAVLMAGLGRNNLQNVPVFNDFSGFIEAKDVNAGPVLIRIGGPNLMTVKYHQVAFCHGTLEGNRFSRVLSRHSLEVFDELILAVSDMRIVLGVAGTNVFLNGLPRLAFIEHHFVERYCIAAIVFWGRAHGSF